MDDESGEATDDGDEEGLVAEELESTRETPLDHRLETVTVTAPSKELEKQMSRGFFAGE